MAVEMLQGTQPFTLTFRGYDKAEVDEYVESLWDRQAEASSALEEAEATIVSLEADVQAHALRVAQLESCVRDESPRTIAALGERVTLILEQAEDAAAETMVSAQQEADAIRHNAALAAERVTKDAASHVAELETNATTTVRIAVEQARQLEADARRSATQILDDAEEQAQGRISDITQWVSRVRAQIKAEQIQAAEEFHAARDQRQTELRHISARRDGVLDSLRRVCESVTETIGAHGGNGGPTASRSPHDRSSLFDHAEADPDPGPAPVTLSTTTASTPASGDTDTAADKDPSGDKGVTASDDTSFADTDSANDYWRD